MAARSNHGYWAYLVPYFVFLVLVERGAPLPLKVAVPLVILLYFAWNGAYPELRNRPWRFSTTLADVAIGVLGAVLWMAPYVLLPSLRPEPGGEFDARQLGADHIGLALTLRAIGFGVVTPFLEELFIRSWLPRFVDVFDTRRDFRKVPIGRFSARSFVVVVVMFTFSHVRWEWPVAFAWVLLTQWWFYRRQDVMALVVVHASSNLAIFIAVLLASGRWTGPDGSVIDLWFFL
ncbi:CAAX prenyl protease-related protein [Myxococcota bacterium]|nr:CAAX prenyl protease-related protein [Myxococcota bacterium]